MTQPQTTNIHSTCEVKGIKITKSLGDGAQGQIYGGIRTTTKEPCAVKVQDISKHRLARFLNELEIMAALQGHENVIALKQSFCYQNKGFIVMDKLETDLMDHILNNGKLNEDEARDIFKQICSSVQHCHNNQIAHLDLKPENILLNTQSRSKKVSVKLCDFGHSFNFSKYSSISGQKHVLVPNQFFKVGTEQYRAPEMKNSYEVDLQCTDVWSLGVILFVMMTGFFPQVIVEKSALGCTDYENLKYFMREDKHTVTLLNIDLFQNYGSDKCFSLLESMLDEDPESRISIDELLQHEWFNVNGQSADDAPANELNFDMFSAAASNPSLSATR